MAKRNTYAPSTLSKRRLNREGWVADDCQRQLRRGHRADLWGFGDVIAFKDDQLVIVQCCERSNHAANVKKVINEPRAHAFLVGDFTHRSIVVESWKDNEPKVRVITPADFPQHLMETHEHDA